MAKNKRFIQVKRKIKESIQGPYNIFCPYLGEKTLKYPSVVFSSKYDKFFSGWGRKRNKMNHREKRFIRFMLWMFIHGISFLIVSMSICLFNGFPFWSSLSSCLQFSVVAFNMPILLIMLTSMFFNKRVGEHGYKDDYFILIDKTDRWGRDWNDEPVFHY